MRRDGGSVARYAVVGNPVAHSLSPEIHAAFARQTGDAIDFTRLLAPAAGFVATVEGFFDGGGMGLNVTLPFKLEAFTYCRERASERARRAGAVNLLARAGGAIVGDNTDGVGLVNDLARLLGASGMALAGARILLAGAGGAARGVIGPLLAARPALLTIVNRDVAKAESLVAAFRAGNEHGTTLRALGFDALAAARYDVIVNATSASLAHAALPLPASVFDGAALAYDMMYGAAPTVFMESARRGGATAVADGLGMLVEQAAESFAIWRGVRPQTSQVLGALRAKLVAGSGR